MGIRTCVAEQDYRADRYEPQGILDEVRAMALSLPTGATIALHGWPAFGKTSTARWLARSIGCCVIHLDDIDRAERPGFDEDGMRGKIRKAVKTDKIVVDFVCACRACDPEILLQLGEWPGEKLSTGLTEYIGTYDPKSYRGKMATFSARFVLK